MATLLAPPTEAAAAQAMTVIGEFAPDAAAGARAAVATWLRELYPGSRSTRPGSRRCAPTCWPSSSSRRARS